MLRPANRLVLGLLAAQLVLAAIGAAIWARSTFADQPLDAVAPTPAAETQRPLTVESGYALAADRARVWDPGARLVLVSGQLDWPLDVPPSPVPELPGGGWLTFVFVRESGGEAESLGMLIERYSGQIVQERVVPWGGPAPDGSIDLLTLPVGSAAAVAAAEHAGGTDFRRDCPAARHQTRISLELAVGAGVEEQTGSTAASPATAPAAPASPESTSSGSAPTWLIGYRDIRDEGRAPLMVRVGAADGRVLTEDRSSAAVEGCPV